MTFEEKYAAQGRKLDELKAKLDAAVDARKLAREKTREEIAADIDALDAKIDEFNASVDAKIDAKAEEIDAKIDAKAEEVSAKAEEVGVKVEQGAAKAKSALTLDKATAEAVANEPTRLAELEKRTAGNFAAAEENARLIHARRDAKCSNAKLRTEMKVNAAKEKVAERKEARDKAAQEDWIIDLLAYANSCYEMAYAWAMEAEYTMMEAAYEIDYYNEKFIDKKVFVDGSDTHEVALSVVKKVDDPTTQVDCVTGATLTSNGVNDMIKAGLKDAGKNALELFYKKMCTPEPVDSTATEQPKAEEE